MAVVARVAHLISLNAADAVVSAELVVVSRVVREVRGLLEFVLATRHISVAEGRESVVELSLVVMAVVIVLLERVVFAGQITLQGYEWVLVFLLLQTGGNARETAGWKEF